MSDTTPPVDTEIDHAPTVPDATGEIVQPFSEPVHVRIGGGREPVRVTHSGAVSYHRPGRDQNQEPLERDFVRFSKEDQALAERLHAAGHAREAASLLLGKLSTADRLELAARFPAQG